MLNQAGIGTARLDTLILLEKVTKFDRAKLLAQPDTKLTSAELAKLKKLLSRRADHEPMAYILGQTEFYGRQFVITRDVLVPRPESETMIDELLSLQNLGTQPIIADVGTGSGALGITAQLELPHSRVDLVDIDQQALKVAQMNVDKFTLPIKVLKGDLLTSTTQAYDVLLCNLPYVPDDFHINTAATKEPRQAIFGGKDGLDIYRKLFAQLQNKQNWPLYFLSEALPTQHDSLQKLAEEIGFQQVKKNDFIQVFKRAQK